MKPVSQRVAASGSWWVRKGRSAMPGWRSRMSRSRRGREGDADEEFQGMVTRSQEEMDGDVSGDVVGLGGRGGP